MALLDCTPLCLSCPGMSTVVALHQAGFICIHVEHAASGTEDLPACVDCQTRRPFSESTKHTSVKAILQCMRIIADVMGIAGFSLDACPPDPERNTKPSSLQRGKHTGPCSSLMLSFVAEARLPGSSEIDCVRDQNVRDASQVCSL